MPYNGFQHSENGMIEKCRLPTTETFFSNPICVVLNEVLHSYQVARNKTMRGCCAKGKQLLTLEFFVGKLRLVPSFSKNMLESEMSTAFWNFTFVRLYTIWWHKCRETILPVKPLRFLHPNDSKFTSVRLRTIWQNEILGKIFCICSQYRPHTVHYV